MKTTPVKQDVQQSGNSRNETNGKQGVKSKANKRIKIG